MLAVPTQYSQEEFEGTKGVIRIRKSKDRYHNGQKKKEKNYLQNITHKAKDRVTRTTLKIGAEFRSLRNGKQFLLH
jgi:hypothetical protein